MIELRNSVMKVIKLHKTEPKSLSSFEKELCYNAIDCAATYEVLDRLLPELDNLSSNTYAFSRALQGPVLEMRLRGVLVDNARRAEVVQVYRERLNTLEHSLNQIVGEGCGYWDFNWQSPAQLKELLYDYLGIPPVRRQGRDTVNRDALERLESYIIARPIVSHISAMRELQKKISVLKTEIDADGRIRTSYNIAGTETGRFSSSFSEFGTGGNLQNVEELLRSIFISDPGMKMAYLDAEQIQSRVVGAVEWNLFGDARYLDACESGDLHTYVSKLCEPDWEWTGDLKEDKKLADGKPYYRHYTLRKLCKSIGHGTNFMGGPKTLNYQYKVDIDAIIEFQRVYFEAFPSHPMWYIWTENQIREHGWYQTVTGRHRWFWGRRDDKETLRQALAFEGQGSESDIVNTGMLNVWRQRDCILLMQAHDAIIIEYPEEKEDEIIPKIKDQLKVVVPLKGGRDLIIPYGCKTGWNWGEYSKDNPDGLKDYKPADERTRTPQVHILHRKVRKSY